MVCGSGLHSETSIENLKLSGEVRHLIMALQWISGDYHFTSSVFSVALEDFEKLGDWQISAGVADLVLFSQVTDETFKECFVHEALPVVLFKHRQHQLQS